MTSGRPRFSNPRVVFLAIGATSSWSGNCSTLENQWFPAREAPCSSGVLRQLRSRRQAKRPIFFGKNARRRVDEGDPRRENGVSCRWEGLSGELGSRTRMSAQKPETPCFKAKRNRPRVRGSG